MSSDNLGSQPSSDSAESHNDAERSSSPLSSLHGDTRNLQQNSVAFPGEEALEIDKDAPAVVAGRGSRTLSDLLRLHAEKGTEFTCSPEEASRLADVLGQWVCVPHVPILLPSTGRHPLPSTVISPRLSRLSSALYTGSSPFADIPSPAFYAQINSGSSPYETEDDFFTRGQAQDDASLPSSKRQSANAKSDASGRPRGQSESVIRFAS